MKVICALVNGEVKFVEIPDFDMTTFVNIGKNNLLNNLRIDSKMSTLIDQTLYRNNFLNIFFLVANDFTIPIGENNNSHRVRIYDNRGAEIATPEIFSKVVAQYIDSASFCLKVEFLDEAAVKNGIVTKEVSLFTSNLLININTNRFAFVLFDFSDHKKFLD